MTGNKGFTLLFAMLVSGILLSIGIGVFNIALKELILSSVARESQFAFFAADTGAECAIYWDLRYQNPSEPGVTSAFDSSTPHTIWCAGIQIPNMGGGGVSQTSSTFSLDFSHAPSPFVQSPACVTVTVLKTTQPKVHTSITSNGFNTCNVDDPNRVQRTIQVDY